MFKKFALIDLIVLLQKQIQNELDGRGNMNAQLTGSFVANAQIQSDINTKNVYNFSKRSCSLESLTTL